jgi:hypothetical protein
VNGLTIKLLKLGFGSMNEDRLKKEVAEYVAHRKANPGKYAEIGAARDKHAAAIRSWSKNEMLQMNEEGLYTLIAPLWAMLIWGNKQYVVDKLISENGLNILRTELAELAWGEQSIAERWDRFRDQIKGMGPAMMSEILCHIHPKTCPIWNRRAKVGLAGLEVEGLPKYDYQTTGQKYVDIAAEMLVIAKELQVQGISGADLLNVDYFIWDQLQSETPLSQIPASNYEDEGEAVEPSSNDKVSEFIHNEVRDKIADIGEWLGFSSNVEVKVADGSKVDTIWQSTIGNMGRVIYVFEVQTKGSIDSLILNLLKSLNNPAVQGVVAVSDAKQLEKIKLHAAGVSGMRGKLKYWDYEEVLHVHSSLEGVNEVINKLGLVPQGFTI